MHIFDTYHTRAGAIAHRKFVIVSHSHIIFHFKTPSFVVREQVSMCGVQSSFVVK